MLEQKPESKQTRALNANTKAETAFQAFRRLGVSERVQMLPGLMLDIATQSKDIDKVGEYLARQVVDTPHGKYILQVLLAWVRALGTQYLRRVANKFNIDKAEKTAAMLGLQINREDLDEE